MAKLKMTYAIAHAIGTDAGNHSMRKAGRKCWSEADFQVACDAFNSAYPEEQMLDDSYEAQFGTSRPRQAETENKNI